MTQWYDQYVPNDGDPTSPIWFVGEAPGSDEHLQGKPFIGPSGDILMRCLERHGLTREQVYLANLFHFKPHGNKFERVLKSETLNEHVSELYDLIKTFRPVVLVPLGNWPLYYLTGKTRITKWRGSIISYALDPEIKVIPTFHPASVLRKRKQYPTFDIDIQRIISDSKFRDKLLPTREFVIDPRGMDLEVWVDRLVNSPVLATDIESVKKSSHILCTGFAPSKDVAVVFPHTRTESQRAVERILSANNRKVFQNGSFDVLQLKINGFNTSDSSQRELDRPYYFDTLIAAHALEPELPRSLEYLASIYTREPYYKSAGRAEIPSDTKSWGAKFDRNQLYEYNGRDCCVTYEVYEQQLPELVGHAAATFDFEMHSLFMAHHIASTGMYRDDERRQLIEKVLLKKWQKKQFALNGLLGVNLNVASTKQVPTALYSKKHLGLPARHKQGKVTADEDAIVSLISYCQTERDKRKTDKSKMDWEIKLQICRAILEIRGYRKALGTYVKLYDSEGFYKMSTDGRVRSSVKVAGTETGRWSMSKYVDGTGWNMQTNPRDPLEASDAELTVIADEIKLLELIEDSESDDEIEEDDDE